jgi:PAS domain S-box-containing protein
LNLVLLLKRSATSRMRHWFFGTDSAAGDLAPMSREEKLAFGLVAAVAVLAFMASESYLRIWTVKTRAHSFEVLQRMADLKVHQIEQWRHERFGDARSLMQMPGLGENVNDLGSGSSEQRARLSEWLRRYGEHLGYVGVVVFDAAMRPQLSEPASENVISPILQERLRNLRPDSDVVELPPYVDAAGRLCWDLLVPLPATRTPTLQGAILLRTRPSSFLDPIVRLQTMEYQSGDSMLWNREGDRLFSMGGVRRSYRWSSGAIFDQAHAVGMVLELSTLPPKSLAAAFFSRGDTGGEGPDAQGILIIGLGRVIRGSSWVLWSRLDSSEVYAPLRRSAIGLTGAVGGLLLAATFTASWLWRQRQKNLLHERIVAEIEQKRLAARLGAVMRHAKDIILVTDEEMRIVDANQQAIDTYGWTKEELLRLSVKDLRAPHARHNLAETFGAASSSEGALYETIQCRKDGTTFPVEISARRVEIDRQPQVLSIIRDITERKQHEKQQREMGAIVAFSNDAIIGKTLAGVITTWNRGAEKIFGYPSAEVVGKSIRLLFPPERLSEEDDILARISRGEAVEHFETEHVRQDGHRIAVSATISPLRDSTGKVIGASKIVRDITERKLAEAELQASQERYRLIVDTAQEGIFVFDADSRVLFANARLAEILGYAPEELIGRPSSDFVLPDDKEVEVRRAQREAGLGSIFENTYRRKNGTTVWLSVALSPIMERGRFAGSFGMATDITERKRAEHQIADSHAQLRVLASHLQEVREEESRRIARTVHDEVGQLLTGIKMDLRWIEQGLEKFSHPPPSAILDKVVEVTELVDQTVITVQRIASELRPAILDQLGLFAALRQESAQFQKRAGITCRLMAPESEPTLSPDLATTCYRITQEALTNVVRHAAASAVEIEFRRLPTEFVLEVRDNGRGIAPDAVKGIHSHGLLGMQERARPHGGKVMVVPQADGGTLVRARFPQTESEMKAP